MTHDEESRGLPTASGHWGADACPGSYLMEKGIPEEPPGEDAALGNHIHEAICGRITPSSLTDEERELMGSVLTREIEILKAAGFTYGTDPGDPCDREVRLWHSDSPSNPFKICGKPDVVYLRRDRVLIIDYKSGRNSVPANSLNKQLRRLAVLARRNYGVSEIWTAIAQPWAQSQPPCKYTAKDLDKAEAEMWEELEVATKPGAPLIAGDWCRYCRARAVCPKSTAVVTSLAAPLQDKRFDLVPAPMLAKLGNACVIAEVIIDAIKGEIRRRLAQDPAAVPGWALEPGSERSEIIDAQKAFEAVARKVSETEFRACCTVWPGKLKKAWCQSVGAKGKAKEAAINELEKLLGPWLQKSQNKPSLVRTNDPPA